VELAAVLRKGKTSQARQAIEAADDLVELVKWRTGSEGRIAALKRQHGWARPRIRGLSGARIWCGRGVLSHNATKIAGPHDLIQQIHNPTGRKHLYFSGARPSDSPPSRRHRMAAGSYFFRTKQLAS
jgi:IS5 family transposase